MNLGRKVAVILRGPPAIGKSTVTCLLRAKVAANQSERIDLDQGWGVTQNIRYPAGPGRYADIKTDKELLVLELGCGEPGGSVLGATKNPREWVSVLEAEGREIHAFLLWTDKTTWKARLLKKVPAGDPGAEQYYDYFSLPEWKNFPTTAGLKKEENIDTTTINEVQVADLIWGRL